ATAKRVPDDGSASSFEARLLAVELSLARLRASSGAGGPPQSALDPILRGPTALPRAEGPPRVRRAPPGPLVRFAFESGDFEAGLEHARALQAESPGTRSGFEPLWRLVWDSYRSGDCVTARQRFEALATLYPAADYRRRVSYWRARCLERERSA